MALEMLGGFCVWVPGDSEIVEAVLLLFACLLENFEIKVKSIIW